MKEEKYEVIVQFQEYAGRESRTVVEADGIDFKDGVLSVYRDNRTWRWPLALIAEVTTRAYEVDSGETD